MEPSISLQRHIFQNLAENVYRDINVYNTLNITHPPSSEYLDPVSRSATGDNLTSSIDLILSQDCGGFNLGSFFVHRSAWSDRMLDMWASHFTLEMLQANILLVGSRPVRTKTYGMGTQGARCS